MFLTLPSLPSSSLTLSTNAVANAAALCIIDPHSSAATLTAAATVERAAEEVHTFHKLPSSGKPQGLKHPCIVF